MDRVGGLPGFRAHMEDHHHRRADNIKGMHWECCPRHCHVVATWRYSLVHLKDSEPEFVRVCLLLQDLLQSCSRGGEEESGRHVL
jgi:hypothetical protein